ncbi:Uncharacterized protein FWK35_00028707, partial [Aphis craccivora]
YYLLEIFPDSDIAKKINVKRTKTIAIIKNVIGGSQKFVVSEKLKKLVFYDESSEMIESVFWQLHNVCDTNNPTSASAEHLFNGLMSTLTEYEIPLTNIIGFGSDDGPT